MEIRKVGVLGCGLMGSGIAEVAARAGYETVVREVSQEIIDKGIQKIHGSLGKAVEKGKMSAEDRDQTVARLSGAVDFGALADCDLVIEAIVENLEFKRALFLELEEIVGGEHLALGGREAVDPDSLASAGGGLHQQILIAAVAQQMTERPHRMGGRIIARHARRAKHRPR